MHNVKNVSKIHSSSNCYTLCHLPMIHKAYALPNTTILHFIMFVSILAFSIVLSFDCAFATQAQSELPIYTNPDTGYAIYMDDTADLLTDAQEDALFENMKAITISGNVAFVSILENPYHDTKTYAKQYATTYFDSQSSTVFLIDMDERYLWIHSTGNIYNIVTTAYANTITDNAYRYASDGDYFQCADTVFSQIGSLLEGYRIAQPMKYISNLLLAIILAMLFNYFLVMWLSKSKKVQNTQLLDNIYTNVEIKNPSVKFLHQTRQYIPPPPPPSNGGNSQSGRSSGGSGGSHGGGGGHRF